MRPKPRRAHHAWRAGVAATCGLAVIGGVVQPAAAEQGPTPSAEQVAAAQTAQDAVAAQVRDLDAKLASAREGVAAARSMAANADMARHSAEGLLERATHEAAATRQEADRARAAADHANLQLSFVAAEVYQQGAGATQLDVWFGAGGPQEVLDRAAGLEAVGNQRARAAADAEAARLIAAFQQTAAAEAEQRRARAAEQARAAAELATAQADRADREAAALAAQQDGLTQQLAGLQHTTAELEKARQDGLAAAEQARRDEAARQAGIAAAAEAARQAQDAAAQQAAAAQAAAAQAAAAQAAAAQAAAKARQAADAPRRPAAEPAQQKPATPAAPAASSGTAQLNLARADMWDRIAFCESSGNWHINTGNGYYGGLQFNLPTWTSVAGEDYAPRPDLASREEQITVANRLYAARGLQPWSCRTAA